MFRSPRRPGARICGARLSGDRGRCRAVAIAGRSRCRWHGGRSTGPKTPLGKAIVVASMQAGRERWLAQMRALKAAGNIVKIPGGRRPKPPPPTRAAQDDVIERARAVAPIDRGEVPVEPVPPWEDQTNAEKLSTLTGKALDTTRAILDLPVDPSNLKLLSIQKDAALSVLSTQAKVDENRLRDRERGDGALRALLRQIEEDRARERAGDLPGTCGEAGPKS